jgi:hypothetical protein
MEYRAFLTIPGLARLYPQAVEVEAVSDELATA